MTLAIINISSIWLLVLYAAATVLVLGILNRVRSILSGRKGPGLLQFLRDFVKLLRKSPVFAPHVTGLFHLGPAIYLAVLCTAMLIIPFGETPGVFGFEGDFIFFTYVMAAGRFIMVLAALDTGSAFQGMGANREALYGMLIEPAFFILLGSFAMLSGHLSFHKILNEIHFSSIETYMMGGLAAYILAQIGLVENNRVPVDDPKTHLELTMIHEVMVLDHSAVDLALISVGKALKLVLYGTIIFNLFYNPYWHPAFQGPFYLLVQAGWAALIGLSESFRARFRMKRNPIGIFSVNLLAIMIFFGVLIIMNKFA